MLKTITSMMLLFSLSSCSMIPCFKEEPRVLALTDAIVIEEFSKSIGPPGGIVSNELGDVQIQVPRNAVVTDTTFTFSRLLDSYGTLVSKIEANDYVGPFQITLPETPFLSHIVPNAEQWRQIRGDEVNTSDEAQTYPLQHTWYRQLAHFWRTRGQIGLGNRISGQITLRTQQRPYFLTTIEEAVRLTSSCTKADTVCYQGKEPVLFIHGYTPSLVGLGGGVDTWQNFPALILELDPKYVVFEFQWITAARFETVATDLGKAIDQIAQMTGKKVHLIAHSFGGILARTYLQGLAINFPYRDQVASVTTLGTPHSGILPEDKVLHHVAFKRGQDTQGLLSGEVQIGFCQQVSCYQMGQFVDFNEEELKALKLNYHDQFFYQGTDTKLIDVPDHLNLRDKPGKFISVLSDTHQHPLPKGLPIQILIGLTAQPTKVQAGDALISYAGQRFVPKLAVEESSPLLNTDTRYGGNVTEQVLGFEKIFPPTINPLMPASPDYWGYRHSDAPVGTFLKASPMVQVTCKQVENCQHAAFKQVKLWLAQHPTSAIKTTLQKQQATVTIKNAKTKQPVPFAYVRVYQMRSKQARLLSDIDPLVDLQQTDATGQVTFNLPVRSTDRYYLRVHAWGFEGVNQTSPLNPSAHSGHLKTIYLRPKPDRIQMVGQVIDALAASEPLKEVTYVVHNDQRWWAGQVNEKGHFAITGLTAGDATIYFLKADYNVTKLSFDTAHEQDKIHWIKMHLRQDELQPQF